MNPCPVCGRTQDRHLCWIDPHHGAYYSALRTGQTVPEKPVQMAAAAQVEKVDPVHPDQLDLFAEDVA